MYSFTKHVFNTLTYKRSRTKKETWKQCSKDFNRFIQKLRRYHRDKIEYLRVVEQHKDQFPHIHVLLQFTRISIQVRDNRWFDREMYKRWKGLWTHGLSDFQTPKKSRLGTLSYLLKYMNKNTTSKTLWKKVYANTVENSDQKEDSSTSSKMDVGAKKTTETESKGKTVVTNPIYLHGIKLLSWSRNFNFSVFRPNESSPNLSLKTFE